MVINLLYRDVSNIITIKKGRVRKMMKSIKIESFLFLTVILILPMFAMIPVNASSSWNPPVQVTNNTVEDFQSVITYDPTAIRKCHIAWVRETTDPTSREIYYANSANWSNHIRITQDSLEDFNPMIDMDANGVVHIVWVKKTSPSEMIIYYTNSSDFNIHVDISHDVEIINHWPTLRVELNSGITHIAWAGGASDPIEEIYYKKGLWGPIQQITNTPSDQSIAPSIDLDEGNNWHIVWQENLNSGDSDIRYINQTKFDNAGAATPTSNYLNVSDQGVDNQKNDLRPDISVDKVGQCHVAWYTDVELEIYYAVSPPTNLYFWNLGAVTDVATAAFQNKNPSIKASKNSNPVIIFERNAQDWDIYATDYNSSWAVTDISVNGWTDYLLMSSIGALDIDPSDRLFATYWTDVVVAAPVGTEVFFVTGNVAGEGIPSFGLIYIWMALLSAAIIWLYFKRRSLYLK